MDVRLVLCLLWALLATANARPSSCYRRLPGDSSREERSCSSGADACIAVHEENSYGGEVHRGISQLCVLSRLSLEGDLDFEFGGGVYVRIHSEICRETNCNTGEIRERSRLSTLPNGRQCPSCFAMGSPRCLQNDILHCQGGANQCVDVVGMLSERGIEIPFAGRGCATKDVAKIKPGFPLVSGVYIYQIKKIQLSPAPWVETVDGF
ncbi:phospholipase A2 inhibitor and Ly6/PLAUR domain-containing protein-like isoform X2 [Chrysemys picta bellii]|uniref:phospholipase A2 inhibitor and Ly6/PLAUR domain-containing protein-like isoform X2 n=1 Tax=Chrysemys picta bellii TaxID=8478 RepID=UPI0032B1AEB0